LNLAAYRPAVLCDFTPLTMPEVLAGLRGVAGFAQTLNVVVDVWSALDERDDVVWDCSGARDALGLAVSA